jgi:tetratricopeptide (TPR) repeat protein
VRSRISSLVAVAAATLFLTGCPTVGSVQNARPATAEKWFQRAKQDFQTADVEEARDSIKKALAIVPGDPEVRKLAARIALARLDYAETIRLLKGIKGSDAAGLRGRALWYSGDLEAAADELDAMLNDPDVVDEWAKQTTKLARRGAGLTPFALSGALLAAVELPRVNPYMPAFVVPIEIGGESALALIATGKAEVVLDSAMRSEPSWVSLRFAQKLEVHDVPALTEDLSGVSKSLGVPIKALLGVNLLRHLNATLDYGGQQFVARTFSPPAPPEATRIDLAYARGGGMILRGKFGGERGESVSLFLDTSREFPLLLDEGGWKKAGQVAKELKLVPDDPEQKLRQGTVNVVRLGAFDVSKVPGVYGPSIGPLEKALAVDVDGVIGAPLIAPFRVTFGDGGRLMWIEDTTAQLNRMLAEGAQRGPSPANDAERLGPMDPLSPFGPAPIGADPSPTLKVGPPAPGNAPPADGKKPSPGGNAPAGPPQRK